MDPYPRITMEEVRDEESNTRARQSNERNERNWEWLEAHASEVFSHRGKYICIAGQELFVGDSAREVIAIAQSAHPDDDGFLLHYVPKERIPRIYAV